MYLYAEWKSFWSIFLDHCQIRTKLNLLTYILQNLPGRGALSAAGRQLSDHSNNRESSLDDSGVVDDHDEGEHTSDDQAPHPHPRRHLLPPPPPPSHPPTTLPQLQKVILLKFPIPPYFLRTQNKAVGLRHKCDVRISIV